MTFAFPEPASRDQPGRSGPPGLAPVVALPRRRPVEPDPEGATRFDVARTPKPAPKSGDTGSAPKLGYFPAIEGLRGLLIIVMLLFHNGFPWIEGGFLSVSTFFTLSGFLITTLLLNENRATGGVDLRAFWARRFRRLMPGALAAMGLAIMFGVFAADAVQRRNLAGDIISCLAYVANWHFLLSNQSYADIFGAPSPVLHFWSLAIEEQFYLLFPLLAWGIFRTFRRSVAWFGFALAALIAGSLACSLFLNLSPDAIYFGTEIRAAEMLVGALVAVIITRPRVAAFVANPSHRKLFGAAGVIGLAASVALWLSTPQNSPWLEHGGFIAYSLLSAAIILAAIMPRGFIRRLLDQTPLKALGGISYGMYLYHWPIFLFLTQERTGLSMNLVLIPRLLVTLAFAVISFRFLETPVRRGKKLVGVRPSRLVPVAFAVLITSVIAVSLTAPRAVIDFNSITDQLAGTDNSPAAAIDTAAAVAPRPRLAVFGDSSAVSTAVGLKKVALATRQADYVDGFPQLGCGIARGGDRRTSTEEGPISEACNQWQRSWAEKIDENKPNMAIVQIGPWEVADHRLAGDTVWRSPGDPVFDAYLTKEMTTAIDTLSAQGAEVMWLTSPAIGPGITQDAQFIRGAPADPARMARVNQLINDLPRLRPGRVHVVDLAGWLAGTGDDVRLRPDGVHFGKDESAEVSSRFLFKALVDAFSGDWKARVEANGDLARATVSSDSGAPVPAATSGPRRKILVVGDESAQPVADALAAFAKTSRRLEVTSAIIPGCGIIKTDGRANKEHPEPTPALCAGVPAVWQQAAIGKRPDIVLVVPSIWDVTDVRLKGDNEWRALFDKTFETALFDEYGGVASVFTKAGATVSWLNMPRTDWGRNDPIPPKKPNSSPPPTRPYAASDPSRVARFNQLLSELAFISDRHAVTRIDFARFASDYPGGEAALLPDGLNVDPAAAPRVGEWLGNRLVADYDERVER